MLRLDPRPAIVWRDPFSLQFGVEPARAVLREVSAAEERLISALARGVTRAGLSMVGRDYGLSESDVESFVARLGSVIVADDSPSVPGRVSITGSGPTAERVAELLALNGVRVSIDSLPNADCDLGIALGHYVLEPTCYGFWLRRDLPHLAVLFGDDSVTIGPLVEAGTTACLYCLEYHRRDADPCWAAIASQLWGRAAESETAITSIEVAARVARLALARLAGEVSDVATSVRLDADTGKSTLRTWLPHPDCGCIDLANGAVSAGLRETDSGSAQGRPRTIAAVGAPE